MVTELDMLLMLHAAKAIKSYWSYKPEKGETYKSKGKQNKDNNTNKAWMPSLKFLWYRKIEATENVKVFRLTVVSFWLTKGSKGKYAHPNQNGWFPYCGSEGTELQKVGRSTMRSIFPIMVSQCRSYVNLHLVMNLQRK